jgi:23S rRNA pseudouridine1911/1915/1917 synthase
MLLKTYLRSVLKISSGELTALKQKPDGIMINGIKVTVRYILKTSDVLFLNRSDSVSSEGIEPIELPLDIIYEDDDMIAVNKPPNMPTHPSHEHQYDTLANALSYYFFKKGVPFVFRAVNRLDRDTSGIVLVAKNKSASFLLSKEFSSFRVEKKYIAVVQGITPEKFTVEGNMKRQEESKMKRVMCDDSEGQYSKTDFERISFSDSMSTLSVTPKTGRTHQIRLHLSYFSHPIIGDTMYGDENGSTLISRQALHAYSLTLNRISDGKTITLKAEPPNDMKNIINKDL